MGLFSKKRKTRVEKFQNTFIQHRIIKLTYLQTIAITGGVGDIKELSGETEAEEYKAKGGGSTSKDKKVEKIGNFLTGGVVGGLLGGLTSALGGALVGSAIKSLFGKKISTDVTHDVKDTGWRMQKTWLQPEFDKIRYAVGIRELVVAQFRYKKVSEVVSQPWISPKDISRVTIITDEFIPAQFPPTDRYIRYYVRPETPNSEWIEINPIGNRTVFNEGGKIVPRIVHFNSEKPVTSRLEDSYVTTEGEVKAIRFRAVLTRPEFIEGSSSPADSYSPVLKSYRLIMHPRGGL